MFILTPATLLPSNESERLATLRHYDFRALSPDEAFSNLLALAAEVFRQPIAFLALVEENEVHFPVVQGAPLMASMPRVHALCSSAILHSCALTYENLAAAPQTGADGPAIRAALALGANFYAAAPLRMPDGYTIGVFCLASPEPRTFGAVEEETLTVIADVTSLAIAVRHLCHATPELGLEQWKFTSQQLTHNLQALRSELQDLMRLHETTAPVPAAILQLAQQRLRKLRLVLEE